MEFVKTLPPFSDFSLHSPVSDLCCKQRLVTPSVWQRNILFTELLICKKCILARQVQRWCCISLIASCVAGYCFFVAVAVFRTMIFKIFQHLLRHQKGGTCFSSSHSQWKILWFYLQKKSYVSNTA